MKRNLIKLFLCMAFLGTSAVHAESVAFEDLQAPAVSAPEASSESCVKKSAPGAPGPDTLDAGPEACLEDEAAPDAAYLFEGSDSMCLAAAELSDYQSAADALFGFDIKDEKAMIEELAALAAMEEGAAPEIPIVVNKKVESFITYFQTRGRKYFEKWLGRSQNYMTMLRTILRENGMPEDLSYIAFIESGLNPTARSRANAVGMWQFIKGTARLYGLRVDWWIDERMDPEKATVAAAKYFKNLYGQFGSWYLAAAGYNAGEGRVMRAVKKHGTEDFWELSSHKKPLRRETKEYVPKYLAARLIATDPVNYGFDEQEFGDGLSYDRVKVSQATDLRVIADAAGTSVEDIKRLNPELLRWFTPPNYPDYEVKIPSGTKARYEENMSKIPPTQRISFRMHKVRRGETISKIAKRYGTQVSPILYLNNLKSAKYIKPGTTIYVPVRAGRSNGEVAEVLSYWNFKS